MREVAIYVIHIYYLKIFKSKIRLIKNQTMYIIYIPKN